jgi:hypothetical protein
MNARFRRVLASTALASTLAATTVPAHADQQTVKLIQLLIQKGILSPGQAKDLLKETAPAPHGAKGAPIDIAPEEAPPSATPGQIHVTYVPDFIRKQIADQVRADVMGQAQQEGWAQPDELPEWTKRFKLYGDLRFRYQGDMFDNDNYNQFVNFSGINNGGSPFDIESYANGKAGNPPFLNTTENRNRFRLRARLGAEAYIDSWVTANIAVGTGADNGPVTPNQTLGSPGDFGKPELWLDRAYFKLTPLPQATVYLGRMDNPYLGSDLMFYPLLGFDGAAAKFQQSIGSTVNLFGTVGGFPINSTAFDFSTNNDVKYASTDAYMAGAQAGVRWDVTPVVSAQLGAGIFDFLGVQGAVSDPCTLEPGSSTYLCDTDSTKPPFLQFGNSVYAIRNIPLNTLGANNTSINPQYFGLASRFDVLDIHPKVTLTSYHPVDVVLEAEFIDNLAYDRAAILNHGPPNGPIGPQNNLGSNGLYQGGNVGYMAKVTVGNLQIHKLWDWNASVAYRYLETDSTLDSIADSDFHQGGTNAQGYILTGGLGIANNTWLSLRYLSAEAISGPHDGNQTVQFDLLSSF